MKYKLVHITTSGEFKTPLVASQLFDQATIQLRVRGDDKPSSVSVWIIEPFRILFDSDARRKIADLKKRCEGVRIYVIPCISRLNGFPGYLYMRILRIFMGLSPVIYHCRGESSLLKMYKMKYFFKCDKIVLDIRGYWPAELLYQSGIYTIEDANELQKEYHTKSVLKLKNALSLADSVTTVSPALKKLLQDDFLYSDDITVVPCCVKEVVNDEKRDAIRRKLGINKNEVLIVYSGTTSRYQHLEDLTLPFVKKILTNMENTKVLFLTPNLDEMNLLIQQIELPQERYIVKSLPQTEVKYYLSACDFGLMIRQPNLVNRVAQPVKIAEYLAAGLVLICEKKSGGIFPEMISNGYVIEVDTILHSDETVIQRDLKTIAMAITSTSVSSSVIKQYCKNNFLWSEAIKIHRRRYNKILAKKSCAE